MNFIETLNSVAFRSGLLVAVPVLFAALSALKVDITKLPRLAQPVLPFLAAALPVLIAQLQGPATVGAAFLAAALEGVGAIGLYHVGKRVVSPGAPATLAVSVVFVLLLPRCAGSFEEAKLAGVNPQARAAAAHPSARCVSLDNQHRTWGAVGKGAAVLAGAEGFATWPVESHDAKIGLAIGAGVTAAVAATAVYVSEDASTSWARECQ